MISRALLALLVALVSLAPGAFASDDASGRWAVIVGVDRYDDQAISPLRYAVKDARAVAGRLVQSGSWRADHVILLTSDAEDPSKRPTRNNILATLRWLDELEQPELVLFYFSGHGSRESTDGEERDYLFPSDTIVIDPAGSGLAIDDVARRVEAVGAPRKLLVLDACRNQIRPDARAVMRPMSWEPTRAEGTYVLLATKPGSYSYEDPRLGLGRFTHALTEGLAGKADGGLGAPPDGEVTVQELFRYVQETLEVGGARGQPQVPVLRGEATSDWSVVSVPRVVPTGRVEVRGDALRVRLQDVSGKVHDPSRPVAAGLYTIKAHFRGFSVGAVGAVEVVADQTITLHCVSKFLACNVVEQPASHGSAAP